NIVVQIQKRYHGHAQQIANTLWGTSAGQWFFKNVMVVEEDIDIRDWEAREWAMAFRVNASENGVLTFGPTFGSPLDPSTRHEYSNIRKYGTARWTRVLIDATRNWTFEPNPDWGGRRMSPIASMDPELERKIAARWNEYGIGSDYLDDDMRERLTLEELRKRFPDV
ncbi:MAG: UbiD family decarboxylase, partial [Alphaproteobacteria bacterium]|nr:UbiD family decarboxylase [Alphaproteobacteria bacterium]